MENKELVEYIKLSLERGRSKEEIYKEFLDQGWQVETIQKAFS